MITWHSRSFNATELIEVEHDAGHTVLRVDNDVDGETYLGVSGPPLSDDDLELLGEDRIRHARSFFGATRTRYRRDDAEGAHP